MLKKLRDRPVLLAIICSAGLSTNPIYAIGAQNYSDVITAVVGGARNSPMVPTECNGGASSDLCLRVVKNTSSVLTQIYGVYYWVDNLSADDYFMPLKTISEWNSFTSHLPAGITVDTSCPAVTEYAATLIDGRTIGDSIDIGRVMSGAGTAPESFAYGSKSYAVTKQICTTNFDNTQSCNTCSGTQIITISSQCRGGSWQSAVTNTGGDFPCPAPPPKCQPADIITGYGTCSVTCGGGTQDVYHSDGCGNTSTTTQACNTQACVCVPNGPSITTLGSCSQPCGGGTQTVTVTNSCGVVTQTYTQNCNTQVCPCVPNNAGNTTTTSACSASCGGGTQTVTTTNSCGDVVSSVSQACNTDPCACVPDGTVSCDHCGTRTADLCYDSCGTFIYSIGNSACS